MAAPSWSSYKRCNELPRIAGVANGKVVTLYDYWIMYFLATKCRTLSGNSEPLYSPADENDDGETTWSAGYEPTASDLQSDHLAKKVRVLVREHLAGVKVCPPCRNRIGQHCGMSWPCCANVLLQY